MLITSTLLGSSAELDTRIATLELWLSSNPYSHKGRRLILLHLMEARLDRYALSRQPEDIDKAILTITEIILLPFPPLVDLYVYQLVVYRLSQLSQLLLIRFHLTSQLEDLKCSIDYSRHVYHSGLCLDRPIGLPRSRIIIRLIKTLHSHVDLEAKSATVTRTIEEMVGLCRELLISDISGDDLVDVIVILKDSFYVARGNTHGQTIDQVVEYIREAIPRCPPGSHLASGALADCLAIRVVRNVSIEDSQEAIALFDKIATSQPSGDRTNPSRRAALFKAANVARTQFALFPNLENLEVAMSRVRTALADPSLEDSPELAEYLEGLMRKRAEYFHLTHHREMVSSSLHKRPPPHHSNR